MYAFVSSFTSTPLSLSMVCVCVYRKRLCPALISMLGNPVTDKSVIHKTASQQDSDVGRGSGCSTNAPNLSDGSAKTVYKYVYYCLLRVTRSFAGRKFHKLFSSSIISADYSERFSRETEPREYLIGTVLSDKINHKNCTVKWLRNESQKTMKSIRYEIRYEEFVLL